MKKIIYFCLALSVVFATGCSVQDIQTWVENISTKVVQQDQINEQGFELTQADLYARVGSGGISAGVIKLENMGLTAIPDFCTLLLPEDYEKIQAISLMQNKIRIVDVDLSCLTKLRSLNLSYNQIEVVRSLGLLPSLMELRLHKNAITTTENFPELPALRRLTLAFNQLKNVDGISHLSGLVNLELHHNILERLDGLEQLQNLEQLKVEYNNLKDEQITPLMETLEKLSLVTAKGNQLKEDLLSRLEKLNQTWVENNLRGYDPNTQPSSTIIIGTGS